MRIIRTRSRGEVATGYQYYNVYAIYWKQERHVHVHAIVFPSLAPLIKLINYSTWRSMIPQFNDG